MSGVTSNDYVEINFNRASLSIAANAEVCPTCETTADAIKLYAKKVPDTTLVGIYTIFKGAS